MVAPGMASLPEEGRPKESTEGFAMPDTTLERTVDGSVRLSTGRLRVTVGTAVGEPLRLTWAWHDEATGDWKLLLRDRPTGAYYVGADGRVSHYVSRRRGDAYFGCGERSGALNRAGRRFDLRCVDAMGYDAERSDPLYKFYPFYIGKPCASSADPSGTGEPPEALGPDGHGEPPPLRAVSRGGGGAYGVFYDSMARAALDFGCELNNYHGLFASYQAECGDLDYYVLLGPRVRSVTARFSWLTGETLLPPRWSLGYSGSTMAFTDAPDAQRQLEAFLAECAARQVPLSSFQLSSGYSSSAAGRRHVFTWNSGKVPDPDGLAAAYAAAGVRLAANIKPCLLVDHPEYAACAAAALFVGASGAASAAAAGAPPSSGAVFWPSTPSAAAYSPERSMFWDADGSHLDFTNPAAAAWWQDRVAAALLRRGIVGTWNDNNEYAIEDEHALCHGFGRRVPLRLVRPLHALLMCQASWRAQRAHAPGERPWLISRSGMPGMQRYVQTWSGDNYTEWKTLRYNLWMGLGLGLSGCFNTGHDVGGFAGPPPPAEMLVRWVQSGVFHPRFTIHSWNAGGPPTSAWLHPGVAALVLDAIRFRYALIPYLYSLLRSARDECVPPLRPTWFDFEEDDRCWRPSDDFMCGPALLVANVLDAGERRRDVYLPQNGGRGWWDWHGGAWHPGGETLTLDAPLDRIPLLAAAGCCVPLADPEARSALDGGISRTVRVFPLPPDPAFDGVAAEACWVEDDGVSDAAQGAGTQLSVSVTARDGSLHVAAAAVWPESAWSCPLQTINVVLPPGEKRPVQSIAPAADLRLELVVGKRPHP
uniref:Glycoside hydrolase family 31 N-terminal domain-containing protein n=2 Tax=Emiliania huxleyi TaxID=2903 RepID=A0A7S3SND6_EMIHU